MAAKKKATPKTIKSGTKALVFKTKEGGQVLILPVQDIKSLSSLTIDAPSCRINDKHLVNHRLDDIAKALGWEFEEVVAAPSDANL